MSDSTDMADASILGSTQDGDAISLGDNQLSFNDSDFYLNMDDVDIGPQIGQGAFSKVYLGRYLGELVRKRLVVCFLLFVTTALQLVWKTISGLSLRYHARRQAANQLVWA